MYHTKMDHLDVSYESGPFRRAVQVSHLERVVRYTHSPIFLNMNVAKKYYFMVHTLSEVSLFGVKIAVISRHRDVLVKDFFLSAITWCWDRSSHFILQEKKGKKSDLKKNVYIYITVILRCVIFENFVPTRTFRQARYR